MRNGYVNGAAMGMLLIMAATFVAYIAVKLTKLYYGFTSSRGKSENKFDINKWIKEV